MTTDVWLTRSEWPAVYGIARVERRGERADGAEIGGARLGFGRGQAAHQLVEARRQRVELAALAGRFHRAAEVARRGHRGDGVRHAVDRIGQRARQPQAGKRREHERPQRNRAERQQRAARGAARHGVDRRQHVDPHRAERHQRADGVLLAAERHRSAQLARRGDDGARERFADRGRHRDVVDGDDDAGVGEPAQVLGVGVVEAGGHRQRAHGAVAVEQRRAREAERARWARWPRRCSANWR